LSNLSKAITDTSLAQPIENFIRLVIKAIQAITNKFKSNQKINSKKLSVEIKNGLHTTTSPSYIIDDFLSDMSYVITRKFSLVPKASNKERVLKNIQKAADKFVNVENCVVNHFAREISKNPSVKDLFSETGLSKVKGNFYNKYKDLFEESSKKVAPVDLTLSERARRCAHIYPYFTLRNWIIERENIKKTIITLKTLFSKDPRIFTYFIKNGTLKYESLKSFFEPLRTDVYGNFQNISSFQISNLLGQIRNILFSEEFQKNKPDKKKIATSILANLEISEVDGIIDKCLNGFTRSEKGVDVVIGRNDLLSVMVSRFVRKIKRESLICARYRLGINKKKIKGTAIKVFVDELIAKYNIKTERSFKKEREATLNKLKETLLRKQNLVNLQLIGTNAFAEASNAIKTMESKNILNGIFNPSIAPIRVKSLDLAGFEDYLQRRLANKVKEKYKEVSDFAPLLDQSKKELDFIANEIYSLAKIPIFRKHSIPLLYEKNRIIGEGGVYAANYPDSEISVFFTGYKNRTLFEIKL
jgi:hypothetical protein